MKRVLMALFLVALMPSAGLAQKKPVPKKPPVKKKAPVKKPVVVKKVAQPLLAPMVGTWFLLDSEGKPVKSTKIVFTIYGDFTFTGAAWKSAGTFSIKEGFIFLSWTSVDGVVVKPGTMKKSLPIEADGTRIQLDRFRYGKTGT